MNIWEILLSYIPLEEEMVIRIIGITGIGLGTLAILALFRAIFLHNSLSVKRAKQMLAENKHFREMTKVPNMPKLEIKPAAVVKPKKEKQPLLKESMSVEARTLLEKMTLPICYDDGWQVGISVHRD